MPFSKGYLAVDFFFMLSGFVLAFGYQARLDGGWRTKDFLLTRIVRLYPLYVLGLTLGFLVSLADPAMRIGAHGWANAVLNLFMLPAWINPRTRPLHAFPYNIPAWSLLLEIVANAVHAVFLRRRSTAFLTTLVAISAAGLITWTGKGTITFGANTQELPGGLVRVLFAYVTGIVLCRVWKRLSWRPYLWSVVLTLLLLALLTGTGASRVGARFDMITVIGIFPLLLFLGAGSPLNARLQGPARELGALSYGVYILHQPVLHFLQLHGWSSPIKGGLMLHMAASVCFVGGTFLLAALLNRLYDTPVRKYLRQKIPPSPSLIATQQFHEYEAEVH